MAIEIVVKKKKNNYVHGDFPVRYVSHNQRRHFMTSMGPWLPKRSTDESRTPSKRPENSTFELRLGLRKKQVERWKFPPNMGKVQRGTWKNGKIWEDMARYHKTSHQIAAKDGEPLRKGVEMGVAIDFHCDLQRQHEVRHVGTHCLPRGFPWFPDVSIKRHEKSDVSQGRSGNLLEGIPNFGWQ